MRKSTRILSLLTLLILLLLATGCSGDAQEALDEFARAAFPMEEQAFVSTDTLGQIGSWFACCAGPLALSCVIGFSLGIIKAVAQRENVTDVFLKKEWRWFLLLLIVGLAVGSIPILTETGKYLWEKTGMDITLFTHSLVPTSPESALAVIGALKVFVSVHFVYELLLALTLPASIWLAIKFGSLKALYPWTWGLACFWGMGPIIATVTKGVAATPGLAEAAFGDSNIAILFLILSVSGGAIFSPIVISGGLAVLWVITAWQSRRGDDPETVATPTTSNSERRGERDPITAEQIGGLFGLIGWLFGRTSDSEGGVPRPRNDGPIPAGPPKWRQLPGMKALPGPDTEEQVAAGISTNGVPSSNSPLVTPPPEGESAVDAAELENLGGQELPPAHRPTDLATSIRTTRERFEQQLRQGEILPSAEAGQPIGRAIRATQDIYWDDHGRPQLVLREGEIVWPVGLDEENNIATIESPRHEGVVDGIWLGEEAEWATGQQLPTPGPPEPEPVPEIPSQIVATRDIRDSEGRVIVREGRRINPEIDGEDVILRDGTVIGNEDVSLNFGGRLVAFTRHYATDAIHGPDGSLLAHPGQPVSVQERDGHLYLGNQQVDDYVEPFTLRTYIAHKIAGMTASTAAHATGFPNARSAQDSAGLLAARAATREGDET